MNLAYRLAELLPLALALGTALSALRHEDARAILRGALGNTARILLWLAGGLAALHLLLLFFQD